MNFVDIVNIENSASTSNQESGFGERILLVLEQQRRSKSWLAEQIGISKQAMNYLLMHSTTPKYVNEIAIALEILPEWLIFGKGSRHINSGIDDIKRIPILTLNDIPSFIKNGLQNLTHEFTHLMTQLTSPCFATLLKSSSMEPIFSSDTLLIFNSSVEAKNGDYVLFSSTNDNEVYFRKYLIDGKETYLKAFDNMYKAFKKDEITILGVLIESRNHFK